MSKRDDKRSRNLMVQMRNKGWSHLMCSADAYFYHFCNTKVTVDIVKRQHDIVWEVVTVAAGYVASSETNTRPVVTFPSLRKALDHANTLLVQEKLLGD
jgi:hypothetical protein